MNQINLAFNRNGVKDAELFYMWIQEKFTEYFTSCRYTDLFPYDMYLHSSVVTQVKFMVSLQIVGSIEFKILEQYGKELQTMTFVMEFQPSNEGAILNCTLFNIIELPMYQAYPNLIELPKVFKTQQIRYKNVYEFFN